jgi:adenylylsulfate kinase-like enzyme
MVVLTGPEKVGKKKMAKLLERELMSCGRYVYYLGMGSFLYGVGADTKKASVQDHTEQIRRFGETANLLLDAGMILVVTATGLTQSDYKIMKTVIDREFEIVWVGHELTTDISPDMQLEDKDYENGIRRIKDMLKESGFMFKA